MFTTNYTTVALPGRKTESRILDSPSSRGRTVEAVWWQLPEVAAKTQPQESPLITGTDENKVEWTNTLAHKISAYLTDSGYGSAEDDFTVDSEEADREVHRAASLQALLGRGTALPDARDKDHPAGDDAKWKAVTNLTTERKSCEDPMRLGRLFEWEAQCQRFGRVVLRREVQDDEWTVASSEEEDDEEEDVSNDEEQENDAVDAKVEPIRAVETIAWDEAEEAMSWAEDVVQAERSVKTVAWEEADNAMGWGEEVVESAVDARLLAQQRHRVAARLALEGRGRAIPDEEDDVTDYKWTTRIEASFGLWIPRDPKQFERWLVLRPVKKIYPKDKVKEKTARRRLTGMPSSEEKKSKAKKVKAFFKKVFRAGREKQ